jgi:hypothetical protein
MYEGNNINQKMNLRTQLKSTRMQKGETIRDYFSKISQLKEQLEEIGDTLGCVHPNHLCQKGETTF